MDNGLGEFSFYRVANAFRQCCISVRKLQEAWDEHSCMDDEGMPTARPRKCGQDECVDQIYPDGWIDYDSNGVCDCEQQEDTTT